MSSQGLRNLKLEVRPGGIGVIFYNIDVENRTIPFMIRALGQHIE